MQRSSSVSAPYLLLYDGHCALCNGSVNWILKHDKKKQFQFTSLQGATAATVLEEHIELQEVDSLILIKGSEKYVRSNAALKIAMVLGGFWKILGVLYLVPRPIRDWVYDGVARVRYRWFGKHDVCPMPPEQWRSSFLP